VPADPAVLDRLSALDAPPGQELQELVRGLDPGANTVLREGSRLRERFPADLVAEAFTQSQLRARAAGAFARADRMYLTRAGWEQASAEVVARHRAARFAGAARVADLCCGIGGDLVALAAHADVLGVDRDPVHLWCAAANARAYEVTDRVALREADVREVDLAGVDAVFVDPARRAGATRLRPGDGEPPLDWCTALTGTVPAVGIKAAPGLPAGAAPPGWEREFVAVHRELKEAALWSPALATAPARATVLPGPHTLLDDGGGAVPVAEPGAFLLDPNPAVTRAGLVETLARAVDARKIDDRIAFLTRDTAVRTPFARTLEVLDSGPWREKELPARLRRLDVGAVDVRRRGLAGDVDALQRRLRLSGSRKATLVMTRVRDRPWALVCVDLPPGT